MLNTVYVEGGFELSVLPNSVKGELDAALFLGVDGHWFGALGV